MLTTSFSQTKFFAADFNLKFLDRDTNKKVQGDLPKYLIPTINKPTRVLMKTARAINHILTNSFIDTSFKPAILKLIFLTIFLFSIFLHQRMLSQKVRPLLSRKELLTPAIEMFEQQLKPMKILMKAYNIFIQNVLLLYKSYYSEKTDITKKT